MASRFTSTTAEERGTLIPGRFWGCNVSKYEDIRFNPLPASLHLVKASLRNEYLSQNFASLLVQVGDSNCNKVALCHFTSDKKRRQEQKIGVTFAKGEKICISMDSKDFVDIIGLFLDDKDEFETQPKASLLEGLVTKKEMGDSVKKMSDAIGEIPNLVKDNINTIRDSLAQQLQLQQHVSKLDLLSADTIRISQLKIPPNSINKLTELVEKSKAPDQPDNETPSTQTELIDLIADIEVNIIPKIKDILNVKTDDVATTVATLDQSQTKCQPREHLEKYLAFMEGTTCLLKDILQMKNDMEKTADADDPEVMMILILLEENLRTKVELWKLLTDMKTNVSRVKGEGAGEREDVGELQGQD